jgi:hypothetical protein
MEPVEQRMETAFVAIGLKVVAAVHMAVSLIYRRSNRFESLANSMSLQGAAIREYMVCYRGQEYLLINL